MTNPLYNENFQGQAGQTARADQVKDELAAVASAFDTVNSVQNSAIKGPLGETLAPLPSAVNRAGLFMRFNNVTGQPEAVAAGFTWKGAWAHDTVYVVGDVASSDPSGTVYVATVSHTSASSGSIDLAKFEVMISGTSIAHNYIINADFLIWQRGISSAPTTGYMYLADHWLDAAANGATVSPSRQAFTLGQTEVPNEPAYFHRSVVVAGASASSFAVFGQHIEGVRTLAGKVATISFWAKADSAKPIALEYIQQFGVGGGSSPQAFAHIAKFNLTTSWQKFTATFNVPSIAGKTIGSSKEFLMMQFFLEAGSDYNARSGNLGHQSGTFDIAQVQLEEGPFASNFEQVSLATDFIRCQRYFELVSLLRINGVTYTSNGDTRAQVQYKVTKRDTNPSIAITGTTSVIAFGALGEVLNVSLGTLTVIGNAHSLFLTTVSNYAAFASCGGVISWGDNGGGNLAALVESELI